MTSDYEDLSDKREEILSYLKSQSLNIFYGKDVSESEGIEIRWKHLEDGWKDFIDLGKTEGITTVVVEAQVLEKDDLDRLLEDLPDDLVGCEQIPY